MAAEITNNLRFVTSNSVSSPRSKDVQHKSPSAVPSATPATIDRQDLPEPQQTKSTVAIAKGKTDFVEIAQEVLDKTVDDLNSFAQSMKREIKFSIDKASGKTIIKVIDSESQQLIRQIPREEVMGVMKSLKEHSQIFADVII